MSRPSKTIRARGDVVQPGDAAGQGRLAAAGLADEAEGLARADRQAHAVDGVHELRSRGTARCPDREVLDHVLHPQQHVIAVGGSRGGCRVGCAHGRLPHRPHAPVGRGRLGQLDVRHSAPDGLVGRPRRAAASRPTGASGSPPHRVERRASPSAPVHDVGTARVRTGSPAAGAMQARRLARDRVQPLALAAVGGQRLQQALGVRVVAGGRTASRRSALLHHLAGVHHHHLVGHVGDHAEVVGDQDDRGAELLLQAAHHLEHLGLHGDVERGGRLVGDEQRRVQRHRHRDHRALAHAAGELVRVVVDPPVRLRDADQARAVRRPASGPASLDMSVVRADHLDDLPADLVVGVQAGQRVLEDHADLGAADRPAARPGCRVSRSWPSNTASPADRARRGSAP